ncbi:MAG: hypothetical protein M0R73_05780 [Dehalococcoidia bacterium]|nr:hypothetical protein [Dehalococcoidia bacterium]
MLILRAGLYVALGFALYVTWASREAGFPIEVAMLRGLLTFMAVAFVSYLAELVVLTAPAGRTHPGRRGSSDGGGGEGHHDDGGLEGYEGYEGYEDTEGHEDTEHHEPANLPATRADRDAAADQRRAA